MLLTHALLTDTDHCCFDSKIRKYCILISKISEKRYQWNTPEMPERLTCALIYHTQTQNMELWVDRTMPVHFLCCK